MIKEEPDKGVLGLLLDCGGDSGVYYNMNELFIDQVRHYYNYTNDINLLAEVFPVLKNILEWEGNRLQPENSYLYESCLNVQISDSHWYMGGQTSLASAYMLRANEFLSYLAAKLGENSESFIARAELIRNAMQRVLWQPNYSHWEPFCGDNLNLAITYYLAGCPDAAYSIIKGVMRSVYNGLTPGGFSSGISEQTTNLPIR